MATSTGRAPQWADLRLHDSLQAARLQWKPMELQEYHQRGTAQLPCAGAHNMEGLRISDSCLQ